MSTNVQFSIEQRVPIFRLYRTFPRLVRDPVKELERIGREARGELVRIDLGVARPYLVTHPDQVQRILRENAGNYVRDGVFWRPLRRLFGDGILSDGPPWELSRQALQPVFTAKHVDSLIEAMASTINDAVGELDHVARSGEPIDAATEMARIVNLTVLRVFFGDKISLSEMARLAPAFETVATSLAVRFLLPFVPDSIALPGDRAFRRCLEIIDTEIFALVRRYRNKPDDGNDIFTALCRARGADGGKVTDRWIRDNLVAMFATGTETTAVALTWLWPLLAAHPHVTARLEAEIDQMAADSGGRPPDLSRLTYTRQVVQELLRLYPVGWMFPRIAVAPDTVGGVRLGAGESLLISPYLTHRLEEFWDRPGTFDPDRFAAGRARERHRYAYYPFGGGRHQCIGMHVFTIEAQLIVAAVLSRFRPTLCGPVAVTPRMGASLRPRHPVHLALRHRS